MGASMSELVFQVPEASYDKELDGLLWIRNPFEFDRELPALYYTWTGPDDQQYVLSPLCERRLYCCSEFFYSPALNSFTGPVTRCCIAEVMLKTLDCCGSGCPS